MDAVGEQFGFKKNRGFGLRRAMDEESRDEFQSRNTKRSWPAFLLS
jgi:hypothetical protein